MHAGDWAAWGDTQHAVPAVTAPPPAAAATPPAAQEEDGGWDAFQGGATQAPQLQPQLGHQCPALGPPQTTPSRPGPLHPQQQPAVASAAPAVAAAGDKGSSAGLGSAPTVGAKHSQKRSAEDIMKMFDMPQQGLGPLPGQQGQGQQQMGLFWGQWRGAAGGHGRHDAAADHAGQYHLWDLQGILRQCWIFVLRHSLFLPDHPAHHLCPKVMCMAEGHFCMGVLDDCAHLSSAVMLLCMQLCRDCQDWLTGHSLLHCRHSRCMLRRCSRWLPT